jgi:HEAT repeat protein
LVEGFFSVEGELSAAEQAHAQGRYGDAEAHLRRLVNQTRSADYEYDDWLRRLAEVYQFMGRHREAGLLYLYLHYHDMAREVLPATALAERARCLALEKRWPEAARDFATAGLPVQSAVAYEEAKEYAKARDTWGALLASGRLRDRPYERALAHFDLGMAIHRSSGDRAESVRHLVAAQRLLEQVADDYETAGERERAFDCYQILLKLGQDASSFENLSEGYLNCIRILKEDGLKFYVLQYYEDFLELALQREEFHAAATLYKEAADYALRSGLPYHRYYLRRSGDTWWREAQKGLAAGAPIDLVENAYLASVECFSLIGNFVRVRETYQKLSQLELGERKRARYVAIAGRYVNAPTEEGEGLQFPQYLRQPRAYGDIWFADLVEWENDGDPEKVAIGIIGDLSYPDGIRRRAVNLILTLASARAAASVGIEAVAGDAGARAGAGAGTGRAAAAGPETMAQVADLLGNLQCYAALSPLERLYRHDDARVRRAAVRALRHLYFKRSFNLLSRGLHDRDAAVREAALEALRDLHFPHAFHPLLRVFREHQDDRVKEAALVSIGRIGSIDAGELLIGVLRQETGPLREVALHGLAQFDDEDITPILRQHIDLEGNPDVKRALEDLLTRAKRRK